MDLLHPYLFIIMEQTSPKKRIEYIDLMKGVCITLVVLFHVINNTTIEIIDNALTNIRMPLYFFLSGLFFKKYTGFKDFAVRKTNKLIIPYLFFALVPFCLLAPLFREDFKEPTFYLMAIIRPYNGPLWFLRCLFLTYIIYYAFKLLTDRLSKLLQIFIIIAITVIVWLISLYFREHHFSEDYQTLNHLTTNTLLCPFMALPFMYVAEWVRTNNILNKELSVKQQILFFIISASVFVLLAQPHVYFEGALYGDIYPLTYISAFSGIYALAIVCKRIKKLFFFSYIGRYSLIVLGTHWAYLLAIRGVVDIRQTFQFLLILALMPPTIWFFKKFFPYFTAQKDLFKYKS